MKVEYKLAVALFAGWANCQNRCAAVGESRIVYEQAVSIITNADTNTTFYPIPQAPWTITDAPRRIDTLVTLSWTSTSTSRPDTPLPNRFVLMTQPNQHQKRQSGNTFVGQNGVLTDNCALAVQYEIINGQLLANSSGSIYYFSTSPGLDYIPFVPTSIPGAISTVFNVSKFYDLAWYNPAFYSGQAQFCSVNGTLYAVFQDVQGPQGCLYAPLSLAYGPGCTLISNSGNNIGKDK